MANKGITYLIENKFYSKEELVNSLGSSLSWLDKLPDGIIQKFNQGYVFQYVGLLNVRGCLIVLLPKYLNHRTQECWQRIGYTYKDETRLLMRVLRLYNTQHSSNISTTTSEVVNPEVVFNGEPSLAMDLVKDYLEYGYWTKLEQVITYNTNTYTRVDWQRTMEQTMPIISNDGVLYPTLYSVNQRPYSDSLILRVHKWAVRYCLETYQDVLPGFNNVDYDHGATEDLQELGTRDYLLAQLEQELRIAYKDVSIRLLGTLILLVNNHYRDDDIQLILFGTKAFYHVWEQACKAVLNDMSSKVKDLLPLPNWNKRDGTLYQNERNRLIPDIVWYDDLYMLIIDAKYYNIYFDSEYVEQNPGVRDVIKQIVYQQSIAPHLNINTLNLGNAFIFPRNDSHEPVSSRQDWLWGYVSFDIKGWETYKIAVLIIPPKDIFDCYINQTKIATLRELLLLVR